MWQYKTPIMMPLVQGGDVVCIVPHWIPSGRWLTFYFVSNAVLCSFLSSCQTCPAHDSMWALADAKDVMTCGMLFFGAGVDYIMVLVKYAAPCTGFLVGCAYLCLFLSSSRLTSARCIQFWLCLPCAGVRADRDDA